MPAVTPALEALVGLGTLYQFFMDREPVDALEKVSQKLRSEKKKKHVRKRGLWARVKSPFVGGAPPSRKLIRQFADEYKAGIADREIPVVGRNGRRKRKTVFFPEAQHVFNSDRASLGWLILAIGTLGIPAAEYVSHPHDRAARAGALLGAVGYAIIAMWSLYREHVLWTSYLAEIHRMRDIEEESNVSFEDGVVRVEIWPKHVGEKNPSWFVGERCYPHPETINSKEDLLVQLDLVEDAIAEWEMRENKINSIDAGYWPAAVIGLALLLTNDQIRSSVEHASRVVVAIVSVFLLVGVWTPIAVYSRGIIRLNKGQALPRLRKVRRIYRRRLREFDSTALAP